MSPLANPAAKGQGALLALSLSMVAVVGMMIPLVPLLPLLVMVGAAALLLLGAVWPLYALLVTLALLFEVIPTEFLLPVGRFRPYELMIAYLAFVVGIRALTQKQPVFAPLAEFRWPMLFLAFCVAMSVTYAHFFARTPFLLADLRNFIVWLTLPMLLVLVRTERERRILIGGMVAIALAMSTIVIVQSAFDIRILTEARVEALDIRNADITRSIAGGATYLMIFSLYYFLNRLVAGQWSGPWIAMNCFLLIGGLAVTFGRGVWVATVAGMMLATFLNRGLRGVLATTLVATMVLAVTLAIVGVVRPRLVEAVVERASGTAEEFSRGGSFGWRALENRAAIAAIEDRPLTGVGLGGEYKKTISARGSFTNETWYIHNAYVGYAVKMGLHAALFPPWMVLCFMFASRRALRSGRPGDRPLQAALVGAFIVPVITSYTQPEWLSSQSVAAFCLIIAALLLTGRPALQEPAR